MKTFPFDFVNIISEEDNKISPFIYNVQKVLSDDLQSEATFGCKINNSHTHAGSKIHFESFIEAELLFHNGYFNQGFATLTIEEIHKALEEKSYESVILIGYENYSELYLQQIKTTLNDENRVSCDYCVYETVVKTGDFGERETTIRLRNLNNCIIKYGSSDNEKKIDLEKSLLVFIVPINTTLSTMDKMIASFFRNFNVSSKNCDNMLRICLITIGSEDNEQNSVNDYWKKQEGGLVPSNDKFTELSDNTVVKTFAFVKSKWNRCNNCEDCFPKDPLKEKPIFDVTRGSVVPMLQLGRKKHLPPFIGNISRENENLKRLWKLSKHMSYRHLTRADNHYQYYFDSVGFLDENNDDVIKYLKEVKIEAKPFTYNYIIAPRHSTNSAWINLVVNYAFEKNDVRVLYFDITKEYRGNIKAKYSDFIRALENIEKSGERSQINFFYVDETIYTGENYLRASNLIKSLIGEFSSIKNKINLFHSIFLLYGRSSKDTQKFFEDIAKSLDNSSDNKEGGIKEYVHINISYMRSHEDACTLCKLSNDYYKILKQCATNRIANVCSKFIQDHEPKHIEDFLLSCDNKAETNDNEKGQYTFGATLEKRLIFIISNLLNVRLNNQFCLESLEKKCQIDIEEENASDKIKFILEKYYANCDKIIELLGEDEFKGKPNVKEFFLNAFVKAISRPYFVYHVRKRQAVLSFCIEQLNKIIFGEEGRDEHTLKLIKTYVKALSDINSNYLIRSIDSQNSPFERLIHIAQAGDVNAVDNKEAFCSISFVHAIKKMMSLTQDTTKSCLLENLLVNGCEDEFYSQEKKSDKLTQCENFLTDNKLSVYGLLYLENNRIVQDALSNFERNNNLIKPNSKIPYYFDNFEKLCEINMCARSIINEKFDNAYNDLIKCFGDDYKRPFDLDALDDKINAWLRIIFKDDDSDNDINITSFVKTKDTDLSKDMFQFFMLSDSRATEEKRLEFYHEDNLSALKILANKDCDFALSEQSNAKPFILLKFTDDNDKKREKRDNAIYFQVSNFDSAKIKHWFAIKLFMSLRHKFASLLAKFDLPLLINEKKIEMQRKALAINKAITHNNAGNYFVYDMFFTNEKEYLSTYIKKIKEPERLMPYDKYYQVLANEFISSLYRNVVKGVSWENSNSGYEAIIEVVRNTYGLSDENSEYHMNIAVEDCEKDYLLKKVILNFEFPPPAEIKDKCIILLPMYGQILSISHLINLMAMNAVEHGKIKRDNYEIKIIFRSDYIMFRNEINSSDVDSLKGKLERYIKIPPWCYDKNDQHVTMWTLYHYYNLHKTKEEGFNYIEYDVDRETNEFYIKFNIIRGEKDE